jgi:hypothetical protein
LQQGIQDSVDASSPQGSEEYPEEQLAIPEAEMQSAVQHPLAGGDLLTIFDQGHPRGAQSEKGQVNELATPS